MTFHIFTPISSFPHDNLDKSMPGQKSHYDVLRLRPSSNLHSEDVKIAYHKALLAHHPDRLTSSSSHTTSSNPSVDEIVSAYKVLSDSKLRAGYDRSLATKRQGKLSAQPVSLAHEGIESYDLEDLTYHEEINKWSRSCRCGDEEGYIVTEAELDDADRQQCNERSNQREVLMGCQGCSLCIRVTFAVEPD